MAITLKRIKQLDQLTTVPTNVDVIVNDANGVTKRAQLSDVLSLANLPEGALERLVKVADQTARYALTTSDVQLGDSVQQLDTGVMYIVVDITKLDQADGYQEYTAATATKAAADESGNNIKSSYASSLEINNGSVILKNKNGTALSTQSLPSVVGTFYGVETTASASASAKTATVSNNDFVLADGITVVIKFINTNTCEATAQIPITLNVNNTGAKSIIVKDGELPLGDNPTIFGRDDYYNTYVYDGTYWVWQSCSIKGTENTRIFTGTLAEWQTLSNADQDTYDIINITDDEGESYDTLNTFVGTRTEWNALSASAQSKYTFVEFIDDGGYGDSYDIPYNNSDVGTALDEKADKTDLSNVNVTGSTNNSGSTINNGKFFYKDGTLCRAKANIAANASLTLNTNYETVTAGGLNKLTDAVNDLNNALSNPTKTLLASNNKAAGAEGSVLLSGKLSDFNFIYIEVQIGSTGNYFEGLSYMPIKLFKELFPISTKVHNCNWSSSSTNFYNGYIYYDDDTHIHLKAASANPNTITFNVYGIK